MSDDVAIKVENLSKCYQIYEHPRDRLKQFVMPRVQRMTGQPPKQYFREFWALKDVSFEIKKGETLGIVGRNGSGKSTLLQLLCGTLNPTSGTIQTNGRIAALLELGSGFNPEFTGRENIYLNGTILGLTQQEIDDRLDGILAFADIGDFIDQPVKTYSSGMYVRLAFSIQANIDPEILIVDEALAVGDALFVHRCMERFNYLKNNGVTIVFVSHDASSVKRLCVRALCLMGGRVQYRGDAVPVVDNYLRDIFLPSGDKIESGDDRPIAINNQDSGEAALRFDSRVGDQGIEIIHAYIFNKSGESSNSVEWGGNVNLVIKVCNNSVELAGARISVGYIVKDVKGIEIASSNSRLEGVEIYSPCVGKVVGVEFNITIPMLHPGSYSISPSVSTIDETDKFTVRDRLINALTVNIVAHGEIWTPMRFPTVVKIAYVE